MKKAISLILAILMLIGTTLTLTSCEDDYTAQDLQDAKERVFNGEGSYEDKRMVKGFYEWKANQ